MPEMVPEIKLLSSKKLVGMCLKMTFSHNRTYELWSGFMPRRKEITGRANNDLISMQIYDNTFDFGKFDPSAPFEKWAAAEVSEFNSIPEGMVKFILPGGLYAVFLHRGPAAAAEKTFRYIFESWLPHSGYRIDQRPHFEVLGPKYKNNDPESEEEVWIPVIPAGK